MPCMYCNPNTHHVPQSLMRDARKASILISKPLTNWKDAVADLNNHEKLSDSCCVRKLLLLLLNFI